LIVQNQITLKREILHRKSRFSKNFYRTLVFQNISLFWQ